MQNFLLNFLIDLNDSVSSETLRLNCYKAYMN